MGEEACVKKVLFWFVFKGGALAQSEHVSH